MTAVTYSISAGNQSLVAAGNAQPVSAPILTPNPVNIVRSSRIPTDETQGRWVNGFSYLPEGVGIISVSDYCGDQDEIISDTDPFVSDWTPYVLSAEFACSTFGFQDADYFGRVKRLLEAATPKLLEAEFWDGNLSALLGNTSLETAVETPLAADSIEKGFALLEQSLADCAYGGRGTIHCPAGAASYIGNFTRREGNLLLTNRDTIVVPGSGYASVTAVSGPFNMYATGLTDVRLSDIVTFPDENSLGQAMDRAKNAIVVKASRYGIVSWDELCLAKVTVTLT